MRLVVSILVSLLILVLVYARIEVSALIDSLRECHLGWMAAGVAMFIPIYAVITFRFTSLIPPPAQMHMGAALKMVLAAATLNMVLPSKLGDVAKAYFLRNQGKLGLADALAIVLFEKATDMLSLVLWGAVGLMVYQPNGWSGTAMAAGMMGLLLAGLAMLLWPAFSSLCLRAVLAVAPRHVAGPLASLGASWRRMQTFVWQARRKTLAVGAMSVGLWFLHLLQIWFFALLLRVHVPLHMHLAIMPLALLAGLLPLTFAGVGTRDATIILLYAPFASPASAAALGLLCTLRYVLPALLGATMLSGVTYPDKAPAPPELALDSPDAGPGREILP